MPEAARPLVGNAAPPLKEELSLAVLLPVGSTLGVTVERELEAAHRVPQVHREP